MRDTVKRRLQKLEADTRTDVLLDTQPERDSAELEREFLEFISVVRSGANEMSSRSDRNLSPAAFRDFLRDLVEAGLQGPEALDWLNAGVAA